MGMDNSHGLGLVPVYSEIILLRWEISQLTEVLYCHLCPDARIDGEANPMSLCDRPRFLNLV